MCNSCVSSSLTSSLKLLAKLSCFLACISLGPIIVSLYLGFVEVSWSQWDLGFAVGELLANTF